MKISAYNVSSVRVCDSNCIGCKRRKAHVMLSLQATGSDDIHEFYFDKDVALQMFNDLWGQISNYNLIAT